MSLHDGISRHEAMVDCVSVLSKLVDTKGKILIPGINEPVVPMTEEEKKVWTLFNYTFGGCKDLTFQWLIQTANNRPQDCNEHSLTYIPVRCTNQYSSVWTNTRKISAVRLYRRKQRRRSFSKGIIQVLSSICYLLSKIDWAINHWIICMRDMTPLLGFLYDS